MRDIVFHLADSSMEGGLRAFFRRADWHNVLGCGRFEVDPESPEDIFCVGGSTDGGLWKHAHEHLTPHRFSHKRAIVILDESFLGSPGAHRIRLQVLRNLTKAKWKEKSIEVVVIQPMLEAWLWADHDNVATAFGFASFGALQQPLIDHNYWISGDPKPKPEHLKDAKDLALLLGHSKMGGSVFRKLFSHLSRGACDACQEPSFKRMRTRLQEWFPAEGGGL